MLQQRWSFNTVPSDVSVQCWLWEQVWAVLIEMKAYCCWSGSHPAKGLAFAQVGLYSSHNGKKYFCHRWLGSFLVAPGPQTHTHTHTHTRTYILPPTYLPACTCSYSLFALLVPPTMDDEAPGALTPCGQVCKTHGQQHAASHTLLIICFTDRWGTVFASLGQVLMVSCATALFCSAWLTLEVICFLWAVCFFVRSLWG